MNYKTSREYFLSKPEAIEDFPFGPDVAVFRIKKKMFATLSEKEGIASINLKCDPDEAIALRDIFDAVKPGYHMNKRHWNTIILDKSIPDFEIERMIDRSYGLVVKGLTKNERHCLKLKYSSETLYRP